MIGRQNRPDVTELKAYTVAVINTIKELLPLNPLYAEELKFFLNRFSPEEPARLADFAAGLTTSSKEELQDVLETTHILEVGRPLANRPFFPAQMVPLMLEQDPWLRTIEAAVESSQKLLGLVLVSTDNLSAARPGDFHSMGTACRIHKVHTLEDKVQVYVEGLQRFRIEEWVSKERPFVVRAQYFPETSYKDVTEQFLTRSMVAHYRSGSRI